MMGPISRTVLLSLAALGVLSTPATLAADVPAPAAEAARRQVAMRDAMQELQEARLAYSAKRYSESVEHYRKALAALPKSPATEKQQKFIKDSLSDALIAKAIDYRSVGRTDEAVEFLKEAVELSPDNKRASLELVHTQDPVRTNPALSPEHVGNVEEVSRLLTLAHGYMDLGKYDEAIKTFHDVRRIDATNEAATRGIEQAHKRRSVYYRAAHDSYRAKVLAEVDKGWEESPTEMGLPPEAVSGESSELTGTVDSELESSFSDALSKMVMRQIVFEDATIGEVIETLQNQIQRFEGSGVGASRNINISANFGSQNSQSYKELMEKRVDLNLSQISIRDVLDMLTTQLGISYYYTTVGVELSYSGKDFGPLVERSFTVPPHFFDGAGEDAEKDEADEEDGFADSASAVSVRRVNPVQALKGMGISFPEGATARYAPSTRTLHVRNTAHNMEEIQELLNVPLSEERQVILNVVAVQFSEKDLEDLGFDWLVKVGIGSETIVGGGVEQVATSMAGLPLFSSVRPEEGDYITSGLRSGTEVINQSGVDRLIEVGSTTAFAQQRTQKAPGIFSFRGVWSAADVAVIMRGLSQKKGVDILQNPQLVFSPGADEQVTFASVREIYYPESYDPPQIMSTVSVNREFLLDLSTGTSTLIKDDSVYSTLASSAHPTDFVRYGLTEDEVGGIGTILQVHSAEPTEDGRFLKLAMTTTVTDFEGFVNWGSPIMSMVTRPYSAASQVVQSVTGGGKNAQGAAYIELTPNYILKPIFKRHLVNNSITVAPGAVLVFAGMKDVKKIRYEDKVPLLGDLPLVGRFFRSEGEEDSRNVLLYFAKVDLVDPAGRDVRTGKRPGRLTESL